MTKILICDDEGIVRQSLQFMIEKAFGDECELEFARNGRTAIELAESFHPDIILMDIQMPGINGIEAMQEIRREDKHVVFIVLTAYDKFEYTQKSIDIGVLSYLTKPINKDVLTETLRKAMKQVKDRREKARNDLRIKEKLEAVVPMIESGFVYSVLMEGSGKEEYAGYRDLLNVEEDYGYVTVIECGDELRKGELTNTVGSGIKLQKHYMIFRETVKEATGGIVGALMANKVIVLIPTGEQQEEYSQRVMKIENTRALLRKLEQQTELKFKAGIGTVKSWKDMEESYREALESVHQTVGKVIHASDISTSCGYADDYPVDLEKELFDAVKSGDIENTRIYGEKYMDWMQNYEPELKNVVRLKAMEFVLFAEHLAYVQGGLAEYRFEDREGYMELLLSFNSYQELRYWFLKKLDESVSHIARKQQTKTDSVVEHAKKYIGEHFNKELSLEEMAKEVGISPYYLSKLFKESEGTGYIEYTTKLRMDYAKEQLGSTDRSVKEICRDAGYQDPNYFSRIFKKWTGMTPTEYRGGGTV